MLNPCILPGKCPWVVAIIHPYVDRNSDGSDEKSQ